MAEDELTPEILATWLKPRDALSLLRTAYADIQVVANGILLRLQGGALRAGAKSWAWGDEPLQTTATRIPARYWSHLSGTAGWWDTTDALFFVHRRSYDPKKAYGRFYGVRFDPAGVQEMLANRVADQGGENGDAVRSIVEAIAQQAGLVVRANEEIADDFVARTVLGSVQAPPAPTSSAPVQRQEIDAWYNALPPEDQSMGVRHLWAAAKVAHEGRQLPRKLVERFGKGRTNGHRYKSGQVPQE